MTFDELRDFFNSHAIDCSKPGFCDLPAFMELEKQDPKLLEKYAEFIEKQSFSPEYLKRARLKVEQAASFLYEKLVEDGRLGACIDASMALSKFLDRESVWNYMASGPVRLTFPSESGISTRYYQPIMPPDNKAKAAHVWVVASPYRVIDITISRQPTIEAAKQYVTGFVLSDRPENKTVRSLKVIDFAETDFQQFFSSRTRRRMTMDDVELHWPDYFENLPRFGSWELRHGKMILRYSVTSISGGDAPIEKMNNLCLSGKYPKDLYAEFKQKYD